VKRSLASLANLASLVAPIVVGVAATLLSLSAFAADDAAAAKPTYSKERADCDAGALPKIARPASRKRAQLRPSASATALTTPPLHARTRLTAANLVAPKDKADCLARIEGPSQANQRTTTSGSVAVAACCARPRPRPPVSRR
jgi:hypothetical protein